MKVSEESQKIEIKLDNELIGGFFGLPVEIHVSAQLEMALQSQKDKNIQVYAFCPHRGALEPIIKVSTGINTMIYYPGVFCDLLVQIQGTRKLL